MLVRTDESVVRQWPAKAAVDEEAVDELCGQVRGIGSTPSDSEEEILFPPSARRRRFHDTDDAQEILVDESLLQFVRFPNIFDKRCLPFVFWSFLKAALIY
jgi:hypothetical protein